MPRKKKKSSALNHKVLNNKKLNQKELNHKKKRKSPNKNTLTKKKQTKSSPKKVAVVSTKLIKPVKSKEKKKIFKHPFPKFQSLQPKHQNFLKELFYGFKGFSVMFLTLCFLATIFISLELFGHQRVFPRVVFANTGYSFENAGQVKIDISRSISSYLSQKQNFIWKNKTISLNSSETGLKINLNNTIRKLPIFNFRNNHFWDLITASFSQHKINPVYTINEANLKSLLTEKFGLKSLVAQNASFYFDDKNNIQIRPEHPGQEINITKLVSDITNNVDNLRHNPITIELKNQLPQITTADLKTHTNDLLAKLEKPITLKYKNSNWKIKLSDHINLIDFTKVNNQINIDLSNKFYQQYLQPKILNKINKTASNIKIYHNNKGKIIFDGNAVNGIQVQKAQLLNKIQKALTRPDSEVNIPTKIIKAEVEADNQLQALGIKELIGVGHTNFAGSPAGRRFNIQVGMNKLNGIIVKPGATFSFNSHLGRVDSTTGYKMALVIKAKGTIPEYGGGLCQDSSTFYKAALRTGLPIVERANHSYAVSYYARVDGYGLDATIYPGVHDLKFTNDTPAAFLIQTEVTKNNAYVKIYGTSDGRKVILQDYHRSNYRPAGGTILIPTNTLPTGHKKLIESAHAGFDTSWNRIIKYTNGTQKIEKIFSDYRATSNKILVGQ